MTMRITMGKYNPEVVRKIMCKPPLSGKIELDNGGFELWRKKRKANSVN
jgi:hypothetical protein